MKVAYFILNNFDFDTRARFEVEAIRSLGHEVHVIATQGDALKDFSGAVIHRIPQWSSPTRKFRFLQYNYLASKIGARIAADIYHAVDLDTLWPASRAARRCGSPLIYEARELYTELEAVSGRAIVKGIWTALEKRLIGKADRIITINGSIAGELQTRYGVRVDFIIRNVAPLPNSIAPIDLKTKYGIPGDHKVLIYQGVLRPGQGLEYLLNILPYLKKMVLIILGDGVIKPRLMELAARSGLKDNVKFGGRIDSDQLLNHTAGADAGFLLMEDVALNNRLALPQKLFQYLVAGIPQIVSPMPEIAGFVEREHTGLVVPLDDAARAAGEITAFLNDSKRFASARERCRLSAAQNNWEIESRKLMAIYRGFES